MKYIVIKELQAFLGNVSGYIIMGVFIVLNSLFMWIVPGENNVLDAGYASLSTMFFLAPWMFLFLIPAIAMRLIAEERKNGTLELLLMRPFSVWQLVISKYLAAIILIMLSMAPTLIYAITVGMLSQNSFDLDWGGVWGSYIGLFMLASAYASLGLFASTLTDNQVVALLIAIVLCFVAFIGPDALHSLFPTASQSNIINLGINEHYLSLSRGVVDTRDVVYFICFNLIALFSAKTIIENKKNSYATMAKPTTKKPTAYIYTIVLIVLQACCLV
ncbi:MAG: ABC transporter permease subunit [Bacteroidales bacterium]|nr:ABC transporter permease subunit [Bacteroidales bacterium]